MVQLVVPPALLWAAMVWCCAVIRSDGCIVRSTSIVVSGLAARHEAPNVNSDDRLREPLCRLPAYSLMGF